uniref:Secreted protein n=1 Tax=Achlya hypogyna TaxID=1202772 RepID=A0A0A7CN56_ACHHY|nr:secreted protein [Achlya hypogyna]
MIIGFFVVDLVGGTLVHAKALSTSFATEFPARSHMNQAALFFAIHNYASSVVDSGTALQYFETSCDRYLFEPLQDKQWLIVVISARGVDLASTRFTPT